MCETLSYSDKCTRFKCRIADSVMSQALPQNIMCVICLEIVLSCPKGDIFLQVARYLKVLSTFFFCLHNPLDMICCMLKRLVIRIKI
jgi:hypothetical protein